MEAGELDSSGREGEGPEIVEAAEEVSSGSAALDKGGIRGELFG